MMRGERENFFIYLLHTVSGTEPDIYKECVKWCAETNSAPPSVAKAMEGILRPLRFTPLIFASKKNQRIACMAALMAFHDKTSDVDGHSLARASFNSSSDKVVRKQYSA